MDRTSKISRNTKETKINSELNIDSNKESKIDTGIGFFDHMLYSFARHSFTQLDLSVIGDLDVDSHHTVEDTGIA